MSVPSKSFEEIFKSGKWESMQQYSDAALQTDEGTTFRIHRLVLAQRSIYFHTLFSYNLNQEKIVISNVDSKILDSILQYIYTGAITLDEKNLCDLLVTSDYLLLDDLLKICESFAIQNMTSTNCLPLLIAALKINRLAIIEHCYRYALVHFEDILETSGSKLEELPLEILTKLLESKSLNVISERSVWRAIVSWTEADSSTRLPRAPILLTCLRHEEVEDDLEAEIISHTIVSSNPHIFGLMLNEGFNFCTMKRAILSQYVSLEPDNQNLPCSYGPRMPSRLYLIARFTSTKTEVSTELFLSCDSQLDFGRQITKTNYLPTKMLRAGRWIYIFIMRRWIAIFNFVEEAWSGREVPPLPNSQGFFQGITIILREQLYYINQGMGISRDSRKIIYRYELENNRWEHITVTPLDIDITGAVTIKDEIFIVGLSRSELVHRIMIFQAYDTEKDSWISLPAPNI
ncbi:Kelch-like protein 17, partial [Araneus ventricosus]